MNADIAASLAIGSYVILILTFGVLAFFGLRFLFGYGEQDNYQSPRISDNVRKTR